MTLREFTLPTEINKRLPMAAFLCVCGERGRHMGACAVFIDAGYAEKVFFNEYANLRIDYRKLSKSLCKQNNLLRAYYYNCLPYQSNPPADEEKTRYDKKRRFIDALGFLPRFEVRL